jgi:hypothetical protein
MNTSTKPGVIRVSIASRAHKNQQEAFARSVQTFRNAGGAVISDWTYPGESKAYVLLPHGSKRLQATDYRISTAFSRAFFGLYGS